MGERHCIPDLRVFKDPHMTNPPGPTNAGPPRNPQPDEPARRGRELHRRSCTRATQIFLKASRKKPATSTETRGRGREDTDLYAILSDSIESCITLDQALPIPLLLLNIRKSDWQRSRIISLGDRRKRSRTQGNSRRTENRMRYGGRKLDNKKNTVEFKATMKRTNSQLKERNS